MNILTLQFRAAEVPENLLPVWRVLEASKVGLQLACQDFESGTLADTVGSDQTENLTGAGHGKTVQLEAVGGVTVCDLALEVCGQVDNLDGVEGALLGADTASDTQALTDEGDLAGVVDFDTQLAGLDDGTRLLALLATFLRLALVRVDDGDTVGENELVCPFSFCDDDCAPALRRWEDGRVTHRVSLSDIFASVWLGCYHQAGYMVNVASGRGGVGGGKRKQ